MATLKSFYGTRQIYDSSDVSKCVPNINFGSIQAKAVYYGSILVWERAGGEYFYYGGLTTKEMQNFNPN